MIPRIIGIVASGALIVGLVIALVAPGVFDGAQSPLPTDPVAPDGAGPSAAEPDASAMEDTRAEREQPPSVAPGAGGLGRSGDQADRAEGADGDADRDGEERTPPETDRSTTSTTVDPGPDGLLMFRGNPTRTFYGTGDLSSVPALAWRYPAEGGLCGTSVDGQGTRTWCGTGWTGQPVVWDRPDGTTEVIFGAYDHRVHFLDAHTGIPTRPAFQTGDIIKGSVTLDPDGYPLLYFGSRDNKLRVVALDRDTPTELWSLDASVVNGIWNNDWDGNPIIIDDVLFEGGENSWFFAVQLNRAYEEDLVVIEPEVLVAHPGYTDELLAAVGSNVSIESSPTVSGDTLFFANSGGRVVGLDLAALYRGQAIEVFDFWMGDDVDATIVADPDGSIYVAAELERFNDRAAEVGQIVKLDPRRAEDPVIWSVAVPPNNTQNGGVWATPALGSGFLYVPTEPGELLAIETETGNVTWRERLVPHSWSSPAIVGQTLVVATCGGEIRAYGLSDPSRPRLAWTVETGTGACIESTPAIWDGRIYVGTRDGFFYAFTTD